MTDRELALVNAIPKILEGCANLLCVWHINKNIVARCKDLVPSDSFDSFIRDWNIIVSSSTETVFNDKWSEFIQNYASCKSAIAYIQWIPLKKKIVVCYTGRHHNFGTTSSSRGEGSHFVIKRYIQISRLDLLSVYHKLKLMLANQFVVPARLERARK